LRWKLATRSIWQLRARPALMINSNARSLSTGKAPGSARQTGQTFVFGSAPNSFLQPHHTLVSVASSTWTSRPTTVSHPFVMLPASFRVQWGLRSVELRHLLIGPRELQQATVLKALADELQSDGQAVGETTRNGNGRQAGQVDRYGANVRCIRADRVVVPFPQRPGYLRRSGRDEGVELLEDAIEVPCHQRPDLLRLFVVLVVDVG